MSLGIVFILILLLVYHFKDRISSIEQKCDTMFEIINNMVQEMTMIKRMQWGGRSVVPEQNVFEPVREPVREPIRVILTNDKIVVSDDDDDSDDESDSEPESESDSEPDESNDDNQIRIITLDIEQSDHTWPVHEQSQAQELVPAQSDEPLSAQAKELVLESVHELDIEPVSVQAQELVLDTLEPIDTESVSDQQIAESSYRKMSLAALKAYVIDKGICTDSTKLKKQELIRMIEDYIADN